MFHSDLHSEKARGKADFNHMYGRYKIYVKTMVSRETEVYQIVVTSAGRLYEILASSGQTIENRNNKTMT